VTDVGESSGGHDGETRPAECQAEPVEVHTLNTTCGRPSW
jgi:hypothetical protein